MQVSIWRRTSIFKNFLKPPQAASNLSYTIRIPQREKELVRPEIEVRTLGNSSVLITEQPKFPSNVYIALLLPAGVRSELQGSPGVLKSIQNTYLGSNEAENFAKLQSRGSGLRMNYGYEYTLYDGYCLPCYLEEYLEVFKNVVFEARPEKDLKKLEFRHQEFWENHQESSIEQINQELVLKNLFSGGLSTNLNGDKSYLPSISDINNFIKTHFTPSGLVYISGLNDPDMALTITSSLFPGPVQKKIPILPSKFQKTENWSLCSNSLSIINLSFQAFPVTDPRSKYLDLLTFLYNSKFPKFQPTNQTHSLHCKNFTFSDIGAFTFTATTSPANLEKAADSLIKEIKQLTNLSLQDFESLKALYRLKVLQVFEVQGQKAENFLREFWFGGKLTGEFETAEEIEKMDFESFKGVVKELLGNEKNLTVVSSVYKEKMNLEKLFDS